MTLEINRLHPPFFAEVSGVDLTENFSNDVLKEIVVAFAENAVLLFRDQIFNDKSQINFTARMGPLERNIGGEFGSTHPEISKLSNIGVNGKTFKKGSDGEAFLMGNSIWHTDSSFKVIPALGSALSARAVPPVGGETQFCDMRAAYDELDQDSKKLIEKSTAVHSFAYSSGKISTNILTDDEREQLPPVQHPMVRVHPESRRKALYVGRHASHILGMPVQDGRSIIARLNSFATQSKFVYTHKWCVNDLVMWDNRMVMHRGRPYDARYKRIMHRTTIAGRSENNPWVVQEQVA
jgi:alpha-ketoglutarate-dependent 2,4-dichlorophenoxyacetate dioxygenase